MMLSVVVDTLFRFVDLLIVMLFHGWLLVFMLVVRICIHACFVCVVVVHMSMRLLCVLICACCATYFCVYDVFHGDWCVFNVVCM